MDNPGMWCEVFSRAQSRADSSEAPREFMKGFKAQLKLLREGAEDRLLGRSLVWWDPVRVAAEVEAFGAYRAAQHWETGEGQSSTRHAA